MESASYKAESLQQKSETSSVLKRYLWRIGRILLLAFFGILLMLYLMQDRFIFPGHEQQGTGSAQVRPRKDSELLKLKTVSGIEITALFAQAYTAEGKLHPNAAERPVLIFFYGNAMCLNDALPILDDLRRLEVNVIVPDYAGYGMSGGEPSERGCYESADCVYEYALSRTAGNPQKVFISGWSLGGAVAIDLASRKSSAGLAAFSTFTRMADMGHQYYPFIPTFLFSLILRHKFESRSKISSIACPILLGHSRGDMLIPYSMSESLAAACQSRVTRIDQERSDHSEFFDEGGLKLWSAIRSFVDSKH